MMKKSNPKQSRVKSGKQPSGLNVGKIVRELREEAGLSGAELCRRSGGLDSKTLTAVEKGRIKNPSITTLEYLAQGLGMTISGIFKRAELLQEKHFYIGNQKGVSRTEFIARGVQLVSFTPFSREFFCGKAILETGKSFDHSLLGHKGVFFIQILVGQVEGVLEGKKVFLKEGESLYSKGEMVFNLKNLHQRSAALLLVTVPSCIAFGNPLLS
ncbi:MAG: helix-turn-helix protein [Candidatus Omnitrophica bacterium ADurb.Bin292]|nr:MAG: helix-turn-helix protein [Candidatus Omnitrophica bacterium ADurb.Bin292]